MRSSSKDAAARRRVSAQSGDAWAWAEFGASLAKAQQTPAGELPEEAYRRGFAEGADSTRAEARAAVDQAVRAAMKAAEEVRMSREAWLGDLRKDLVTLAAGITATVIERTVDGDSKIFEELVDKAIRTFPAGEAIRIRLHPADHLAITSAQAASPNGESRNLRWQPDPQVARGGCIVEGPDRIVDARVDDALRRVIRALADD